MRINPSAMYSSKPRVLSSDDEVGFASSEETIVVKPVQPYGYQLTFNYEGETINKWTSKVPGKYLCGAGDSWDIYHDKDKGTQAEIDSAGALLVFFLACILTVAFTGTWPTLVSLSMSVEMVQKKLNAFANALINMLQRSSVDQTMNIFSAVSLIAPAEQADSFRERVNQTAIAAAEEMDRTFTTERKKMEKELKDTGVNSDRQRRMNIFSKVYMGISGVLFFLISVAVAQIVCGFFKWPNLIKMVPSNTCYFLDTSELPMGFTLNTSMETHKFAKTGNETITSNVLNKLRSQKAEQYTNLNTASFSITGDTAIITSDCEASWLNLDDQNRYVVIPNTAVQCKPVTAATIKTRASRYKEKCGDSALYSMNNINPEVDTEYKWLENGVKKNACTRKVLFISTTCDKVWEDSVGFTRITEDNWSYCQIFQQEMKMLQVDSDGNVIEDMTSSDFTPGLTVDYRAAREYGWYTNGIDEIVVTSDFNEGVGSDLLFGETAELPDDQLKTLLVQSNYWSKSDGGWEASAITGLNTKPATFTCKMQYILSNVNNYRQVTNPCTSVTAENIEGNYLRFTTTSEQACSVSIGFGNDEKEQAITLKSNAGTSLLGAKTWRCSSASNGIGTQCTADTSTPMIPINAPYTNSSRTPDVSNEGPITESMPSQDSSLSIDSLLKGLGIENVLAYAGIAAAIGGIIFLLVKTDILSKLCSGSSKKEKSSSSSSSSSRSSSSSTSYRSKKKKQINDDYCY